MRLETASLHAGVPRAPRRRRGSVRPARSSSTFRSDVSASCARRAVVRFRARDAQAVAARSAGPASSASSASPDAGHASVPAAVSGLLERDPDVL